VQQDSGFLLHCQSSIRVRTRTAVTPLTLLRFTDQEPGGSGAADPWTLASRLSESNRQSESVASRRYMYVNLKVISLSMWLSDVPDQNTGYPWNAGDIVKSEEWHDIDAKNGDIDKDIPAILVDNSSDMCESDEKTRYPRWYHMHLTILKGISPVISLDFRDITLVDNSSDMCVSDENRGDIPGFQGYHCQNHRWYPCLLKKWQVISLILRDITVNITMQYHHRWYHIHRYMTSQVISHTFTWYNIWIFWPFLFSTDSEDGSSDRDEDRPLESDKEIDMDDFEYCPDAQATDFISKLFQNIPDLMSLVRLSIYTLMSLMKMLWT